jgi:hypothetical protein
VPFTVEDDRAGRGGDEQADEHVEQPGAAHRDREAVDREQPPGEGRPPARAEQAQGEQAHEQHGERAGQRGRQPPRPALADVGVHAEPDEPLAERRVDDERPLAGQERAPVTRLERRVRVVGPLRLAAAGAERPGILDVVGLVEHERVGPAEPPQPQAQGEQGDGSGTHHAQVAPPVPGRLGMPPGMPGLAGARAAGRRGVVVVGAGVRPVRLAVVSRAAGDMPGGGKTACEAWRHCTECGPAGGCVRTRLQSTPRAESASASPSACRSTSTSSGTSQDRRLHGRLGRPAPRGPARRARR